MSVHRFPGAEAPTPETKERVKKPEAGDLRYIAADGWRETVSLAPEIRALISLEASQRGVSEAGLLADLVGEHFEQTDFVPVQRARR